MSFVFLYFCVKLASELLAAAEKYQLDDLKDLCEEQLMASTEPGNALAHLLLANRFRASALRQKAMEFVLPNMQAIHIFPNLLCAHPAEIHMVADLDWFAFP
jgi:hypothetical protein